MRILTALAPVAAITLLAACDSPANNEVLAAPDEPVAEAPEVAGATPMPAGLNAEERFIWSTLTPAAQAQAAEFIANGGTLTQFINA